MLRRQRWIALLIAPVLAMTACGTTEKKPAATDKPAIEAGATAKQGGIWRQSLGEPAAIDPFNVSETNGTRVVKRLFVGLTTFDGNPEVVMRPGVAERWSPTNDCRQWTFNLRSSRFSNGESVTAESFIRGWTRAADGRAASRVAGHLAGIQGYDELHGTAASGPTATTFSGLSAPDPQTLVVRLNASDCEFDKKTLHPVYSPVPTVAGGFDNRTYGEAPVGNGPFMMKPGTPWQHDKGISLVRNDSYFGPKPNIDGIEFVIYPGQTPPGTAYTAFQAGDLDIAGPPSGQRRQAQTTYGAEGGFYSFLQHSVSYLRPNVRTGPLRDPDARRAVSLAIDRQAISDAVGEGFWQPATALVPPPLGNYHQPGVCDVCRFDPAKAKEMALKGGLTPGTRLRFLAAGTATDPSVTAMKDQLERNLGIVVDVQAFPLAEALAKRDAGDYDLASFGWNADYPTPDNFLFPLLAAASAQNRLGYESPEVDALIQQARSQRNEVERKRLYQTAERLAIGRDVALIPGWHVKSVFVFDAKKWTNVTTDFFGHVSYETMSLK